MAEGRVERRLAAIPAADVVGYSRLIEADEVGTRARLRSLLAQLIGPRTAADGGLGINMGDVIVKGDDIHGEGVNVASRLEGLCKPGEVYVSAQSTTNNLTHVVVHLEQSEDIARELGVRYVLGSF